MIIVQHHDIIWKYDVQMRCHGIPQEEAWPSPWQLNNYDYIYLIYFAGTAVWKVRYATPTWLPGTEGCNMLCNCDGEDITWHEHPLVFDMTSDPRESHPLSTDDRIYTYVMDVTNRAKKEHLISMKSAPSPPSFTEIRWKPHLQPCCNFPFCSCTDPKYP